VSPPPAAVAVPETGVSTSPSLPELKAFACLVLSNCGVRAEEFGLNRINRLAVRFRERMPNGSGWAFYLYLTNAFQISREQKQSLLCVSDVTRWITYNDPTGEQAVNNVRRQRGY
jgi:hypothetical protein